MSLSVWRQTQKIWYYSGICKCKTYSNLSISSVMHTNTHPYSTNKQWRIFVLVKGRRILHIHIQNTYSLIIRIYLKYFVHSLTYVYLNVYTNWLYTRTDTTHIHWFYTCLYFLFNNRIGSIPYLSSIETKTAERHLANHCHFLVNVSIA